MYPLQVKQNYLTDCAQVTRTYESIFHEKRVGLTAL